jgi:hypothetical protein
MRGSKRGGEDGSASTRKRVRPSESEPVAPTLASFKSVYKVIDRMHEPIAPVGSSEHSITGNVTAGSFLELISKEQELSEEYCMNSDSIFIDIGSGMGRPTLCMATVPIAHSIGIEVQEDQVKMSLLALKKLSQVPGGLAAPVYIEHCNVMSIKTLSPVTHAHMFLWANPALLHHAASLLAWSETVKVATIIYRGTPSELRALGILDEVKDQTSNSTIQVSMKMPGQHSYGAYIFCMTDERRKRMQKLNPKPQVTEGAKEVVLSELLKTQDKFMASIEEKIAHRGCTLRSKKTLQPITSFFKTAKAPPKSAKGVKAVKDEEKCAPPPKATSKNTAGASQKARQRSSRA